MYRRRSPCSPCKLASLYRLFCATFYETAYSQLRYFNRAVLDFSEVVRSVVDSKADWNMIGLCRGQLGEPQASADAYRRALSIDHSFKASSKPGDERTCFPYHGYNDVTAVSFPSPPRCSFLASLEI